MAVKQLLLLGLVGLLAVTVQAEEKAAKEEKSTKEEDDDERKVTVKLEDDGRKVRVKSEKEVAGVETKYDYTFSVRGFPNIRFEHKMENDTHELETNFRVGLKKLVEVEGGASPFNSTQVTKLTGTGVWSPITISENATASGSVWTFSSWRKINGVNVTWETFVTNSSRTGVAFNPKSVKFSLRVSNYTYTSTAADTKLAIVGTAYSSKVIENEVADTEVEISNGGEFTWDKFVTIDNSETKSNLAHESRMLPKAAKSQDEEEDDEDRNDEQAMEMAWTVEKAKVKNFYWDPTLGTASSAATAGFSAFLIAFAALFTMF